MVVNNKKSAKTDEITLIDPLKKVVKVTKNLDGDHDLLDSIRKENPVLNIKDVTIWSNNFLQIELHEATEVDSISILKKDFILFPYTLTPTKCGYCQKWGHPTKNCRSTKPPVCHQCSLSHPKRNTPCPQTKCVNCGGKHKTNDKTCSAYKRSLQFLSNKIKNAHHLQVGA